MSNTIEPKPCPRCGAPIPAEASQGLCPKCVLLGAATATEAGGSPTATAEIPSIERLAAAFPQLEIVELVGRGGMGFVFKARQPHLDRLVALKLLPDKLAKDPRFAERFNREGRVLAKLNHPNIVAVYDFGQTEHFYFLLMEFVDGVNLRQAMKAGRFSPGEALAIVPKICEALQYAHGEGILHRDIKPENILLDARGLVKIADFGIAKLVGEDKADVTLTATGAALGTPHYMAPEQLEKPAEVDHRADIYSLGVVFYEMLTGELPIGRFAAPSSKTPVGVAVDEVVFRTLEKDRERRFQSAGEMKTQVEHLTDGAGGHEGATSTAASNREIPAPRFVKPLGIMFLVLGALALIPTFLSIGTERFVISLFTVISLTGVALLSRSQICRQVAIGLNALGVLIPWLSAFKVATAIQDGALAIDWKPTFHDLPNSAWLAVFFALLETFVFGAGLWVLLRRDVREWFTVPETVGVGPHGTAWAPDISAARSPAKGLVAVGVFNWLSSIMVVLVLAYPMTAGKFPPAKLGVIALLMMTLSSLILVAGLKMLKAQNYPFVLAGCFVAMIATPGNIIGLPVGLWALVALRQPKVRAAFLAERAARGSGWMNWSHATTAALLGGILLGVIAMVPWRATRQANGSSEDPFVLSTNVPSADPIQLSYQTNLEPFALSEVEAAPKIQFTFTAVELQEEGGAHWLAMDYVEQARGNCERTVRYDARVPGFTGQTRITSFVAKGAEGFEPVLHQRAMWKLPEAFPREEREALRDLVRREWMSKSAVIEPGDERVLFKTLVPGGGSLTATIGAKSGSRENPAKDSGVTSGKQSVPQFELERMVVLKTLGPDHPQLALDRTEPVTVPDDWQKWDRVKLLVWLAEEGVDMAVIDYGSEKYGWGLAMPATAKRINNVRWENIDLKVIEDALTHGAVDLERMNYTDSQMNLYRLHYTAPPITFALRTRGGRLAALQIAEIVEAIPGVRVRFKIAQKAEKSSGLGADGTVTGDSWAPQVPPGEKPKPYEILQEAAAFTKSGMYEEALQRHVWYHHHALEFQPSQAGVRLSFALAQWVNLARHYPKARKALSEIRDHGTRELTEGRGNHALFVELTTINNSLGEDYATRDLLRVVEKQDPRLARRCYPLVEDQLVQAGEYALCESFIPDVQKRFSEIRGKRESLLKMDEKLPLSGSLRRQHQLGFVKETRNLIEILVGVGRRDEAEGIREQALAVLDAPELKQAVNDAELRVKNMKPPGSAP